MHRTNFSFELPDHLIARYPLPERSAARLLCLDAVTGAWRHGGVRELPDLLRAGDLLVFNQSRVMPARLFGRKASGGQVEILIERLPQDAGLPGHVALAHVRASKSPKPGSVITLSDGTAVTVHGRADDLFVLLAVESWHGIMARIGAMPLPPYFQRAAEASDDERYQTVYAREAGSVAAPTAGLHFDEALLAALRARGVETAFVTLHVGAGTFQPVRADDIADHVMHAEWLTVGEDVVAAVRAAKARGGRVVAVGTTSVRALESAAWAGLGIDPASWSTAAGAGSSDAQPALPDVLASLRPHAGDTRIFISPGYRWQLVDALFTNFHLPESTLLMLVSALAGRESVLAAYAEAVRQQYRFFSYGDAMFIAPGAAAPLNPESCS